MVVTIAGLWELGWTAPISEIDLWNVICIEFNIQKLLMVPVTGVHNKCKVLQETNDLPTVLKEINFPIIIFDELAENTLEDLIHPNDCVYLFGKATRSGVDLARDSKLPYTAVRVKTPANKGSLWAFHIASIVLYDRQVKAWLQQ